MDYLKNLTKEIIDIINLLPIDDKVSVLNFIRSELHEVSPFRNEPVDFVKWVKNDSVEANDYNPNKVAPPEMQLLEVSIISDGYTQPIVTFPNKEKVKNEVVDGFHRSRVGKESMLVKARVNGYLPIVSIRSEQQGKSERIASTIRHNRARGKHQVSAMSEIVMELKNRNWANARIARELGMDEDEILRLCQVSGLESLFTDKDFSRAWVSNDCEDSGNYEMFEGEITEEDINSHRIPNENDTERIFHTYTSWELIDYNFFGLKHKTLTKVQCEYKYYELLKNEELFNQVIIDLFKDCEKSCEHNLTNKSMNRVAWIGQAALAYKYNIPAIYCAGFQLLTDQEKDRANEIAWKHLNEWLTERGMNAVTIEEALLITRQVELY